MVADLAGHRGLRMKPRATIGQQRTGERALMQPLAEDQRHDIWLTDWQNQRDIERVPRVAAIYPRKYCRQSSESLYMKAAQAAAFFCLYGIPPAYTAALPSTLR